MSVELELYLPPSADSGALAATLSPRVAAAATPAAGGLSRRVALPAVDFDSLRDAILALVPATCGESDFGSRRPL
jgi:hypothetical protein